MAGLNTLLPTTASPSLSCTQIPNNRACLLCSSWPATVGQDKLFLWFMLAVYLIHGFMDCWYR